MRKSLFLFLSLAIAALHIRCAQQTSPTGGPKDTIPPSLTDSRPQHGTTNFKGKTVELQFDELLVLNSPTEQIIITPDVGKKYDINLRKDKVVIEFEEDLLDNTTYSLNFRDAVQDLTEKNPVQNLKLAFSTGPYIDSLSIKGYVVDPLTNSPPKDGTIALYQSDTFNIFKHKPSYLTKSSKRGRFTINNLKPGQYFVYAFEDKNRNLIVDSKSESYGFLTDTVQLDGDVILKPLSLIKLDARELKLTSTRPYNTYSNIKVTKGLASYELSTQSGDSVISSFAEDRSNIKVYNTFGENDSTQVKLFARDSIGNQIDTTLYVKFNKKKIDKEKFDARVEDVKVFTTDRILTATLRFSKPVQTINFDSAFISIDSSTTVKLQASEFIWEPENNVGYLKKTLDKLYFPSEDTEQEKGNKQKTWSLQLRPGSFISIENDSTSDLSQNIRRITKAETGVLLYQITTTAPNFIVQLVDKSFKVIQSYVNRSKGSFPNILPGEYYLRVVVDYNGDGKWTAGNFEKKLPTDQIIYYQNDKKLSNITIKANWELGPLLISTE